MYSGMKTNYPYVLNKEFNSKFFPTETTTKTGVELSKHCDYNNQDKKTTILSTSVFNAYIFFNSNEMLNKNLQFRNKQRKA